MKPFQLLLSVLVLVLFSCGGNKITGNNKQKWLSLFNGKNLEGWQMKIAGYPLGENYGNTFVWRMAY